MDDLSLAIELARVGADVVRNSAASDISYKADASPVTQVDAAAEAAITGVLRRERPGDGIVAEESGAMGEAARLWYIDPLDGTVNFINGIPQVSVSVALWEGGAPQVAVVHDVFRGEVFSAAAGRGAFLDGRPATVSGRTDLYPAVVATGFPYDHRDDAGFYVEALRQVLARVQGIRRLGSAALDLAWTAAGRFDGYYETGIAPWDIAAGILLVREAGGIVSDMAGAPAAPDSPAIVAAGPGVHAELLELVAAAFS